MQLCCIPLRDLRDLRENIHTSVLNLHCTQKPHVSPADLADYRRQTPKTTITTTCLSLRNNAACCITLRDLRNLRENKRKRTQSISTNETPKSPADLADLRRRNPKQQNSNNPKTTILTNLSFSAK